jgi:hypothetical protein
VLIVAEPVTVVPPLVFTVAVIVVDCPIPILVEETKKVIVALPLPVMKVAPVGMPEKLTN